MTGQLWSLLGMVVGAVIAIGVLELADRREWRFPFLVALGAAVLAGFGLVLIRGLL